jgi:hypothetical protein
MEIPLYEDPQVFIRNSAVYFANKLKAPLLLSVGDHDGASDRRQDIELYNSAQRAGKNCVMLVYVGENHSVALKATQLDYHRRINEWFDHYVKSEASGMDRQGRAGAGARAGVEGQGRRARVGGSWKLVGQPILAAPQSSIAANRNRPINSRPQVDNLPHRAGGFLEGVKAARVSAGATIPNEGG